MQSISLDTGAMNWAPGQPILWLGCDLRRPGGGHLRVLSDRRSVGVGIAWLFRFTPQEGKASGFARRVTTA
jgi:hypothetical protein